MGALWIAHCLPLFLTSLLSPQEFQKELSQWRKDPSGGKKKPKYTYKTVEELKAKGRAGKQLSAPQKELTQVKVRWQQDGRGGRKRWAKQSCSIQERQQ